MLAYGTTAGGVHGWDLRARREAWSLPAALSTGLLQVLARYSLPSVCSFVNCTGLRHFAEQDLDGDWHKHVSAIHYCLVELPDARLRGFYTVWDLRYTVPVKVRSCCPPSPPECSCGP
jgi:hypothetical protein